MPLCSGAIVMGKARDYKTCQVEIALKIHLPIRSFTSAVESMRGQMYEIAVNLDPSQSSDVLGAFRDVTGIAWSPGCKRKTIMFGKFA